jgi:hypothetical protein
LPQGLGELVVLDGVGSAALGRQALLFLTS